MHKAHVREPKSFGNRKHPHSIAITRNGKTKHYAVNPTYFAVTLGVIAMFFTGYLVATTYLVLRDDLITANSARQARIHHEYEDRIAALRSNLDRITSRQLLDQQALENQIADMVERQKVIGARGPLLSEIIEKARAIGISNEFVTPELLDPDPIKTGSIKAEKKASLTPKFGTSFKLRGFDGLPLMANAASQSSGKIRSRSNLANNDITPMFDAVATSLAFLDKKQKSAVSSLRKNASEKTKKIVKLLRKAGANFPKKFETQIGGPFIELDLKSDFSSHVEALDDTLDLLEQTEAKIENFPVANPARNHKITSRFGTRMDPFRHKYAMHSGLDFRGNYGDKVRATAKGKVIHASRKGGYGKMVEIDHGNGRTTRYAHLSKIKVKLGQWVKLSQLIGTIGSTGRSTGPHLHYEVRVNGKARNPANYIDIGRKLNKLL